MGPRVSSGTGREQSANVAVGPPADIARAIAGLVKPGRFKPGLYANLTCD
jgi:hypothetical protein